MVENSRKACWSGGANGAASAAGIKPVPIKMGNKNIAMNDISTFPVLRMTFMASTVPSNPSATSSSKPSLIILPCAGRNGAAPCEVSMVTFKFHCTG